MRNLPTLSLHKWIPVEALCSPSDNPKVSWALALNIYLLKRVQPSQKDWFLCRYYVETYFSFMKAAILFWAC